MNIAITIFTLFRDCFVEHVFMIMYLWLIQCMADDEIFRGKYYSMYRYMSSQLYHVSDASTGAVSKLIM